MTSRSTLTSTKDTSHPAMTIIMQWLTYALFGWLAISLTWLVHEVARHFIHNQQLFYAADGAIYPLAASVVLLVVAVIVNSLYGARETKRKRGFESVLMSVHAVLFALFAVGALILVVFNGLQLIINPRPTGSDDAKVMVLTWSFAMVAAGVLLARVLLPAKMRMVATLTAGFMAIATIGLVVMAFVGPVRYSVETKNDRLIEESLPNLTGSINSYAQENGKLPTSLERLLDETNNDAPTVVTGVRELIDRKLVKYTPNHTPVEVEGVMPDDARLIAPTGPQKVYKYQLCVTYAKEKKGAYDGYATPASKGEVAMGNVSTTVSSWEHPAGEKCYELATSDMGGAFPVDM